VSCEIKSTQRQSFGDTTVELREFLHDDGMTLWEVTLMQRAETIRLTTPDQGHALHTFDRWVGEHA